MRKYVLRLLPLYLDFIWIWTVIGLVDYLSEGLIGGIFGDENAVLGGAVVSLLIAVVLAVTNLSIGERLLHYAKWEEESGVKSRQWPNLLLGTMLFLSGLKEIVGWTEPGTGMPAFFLVEETPLKIAVLTLYGVANLVGGVMLLGFYRGAKLYNWILLAVVTIPGLASYIFFRAEMIAALMARRDNQGLPMDAERAETYINAGPVLFLAIMVLMAVILYFCRERQA